MDANAERRKNIRYSKKKKEPVIWENFKAMKE